MHRIQIVGVLADPEALKLYRLICRLEHQGETRDYYIYADRATVEKVDRILSERPFKRLRRHPDEAAELHFAGHAWSACPVDPPLTPARATAKTLPTTSSVLYLVQSLGRSRAKHRLEVPVLLVQQLLWLQELTCHDPKLSLPLLEA